MLGWIRTVGALTLVTTVTVPMAAAQLVALRTRLIDERRLPRLWHRFILRVLDLRIRVHGRIADDRPLMLASNHVSWTDIMVAGAAADVNFIAKSEVSGWPMFGTLARLQRTVFVERGNRRGAGSQAGEIAERLRRGDPMVLFAEGSTGDGNLMLPFKSALFGAAGLAMDGEGTTPRVVIQPVAIVYARLHGMPMGRQHRRHAAWIGERALLPHMLDLLKEGGLDAEIHFGEPVEYRAGDDRKAVAREVERRVRALFAAALRDSRAR